jgi:hypothetical protein
MRRLDVVAVLLLAACAGCDGAVPAEPPADAAPLLVPPPPPPPPLPTGSDVEAAARAAALAAGPGTCEEDVRQLVLLPTDNRLGRDPHFDRIAVHPDAYKACLVAMVPDATPIADPGEGPKHTPYAQGDLAYDLLFRLDFIWYGECIAGGQLNLVELSAPFDIYAWLDAPAHRREAHACLAKKFAAAPAP